MKATRPAFSATPFAEGILVIAMLMATGALAAAAMLFFRAHEGSWLAVATPGLTWGMLAVLFAPTSWLLRRTTRRGLRILLAVAILAAGGALSGWLAARWLQPNQADVHLDRGLWWGIALGVLAGWRPARRLSINSAIKPARAADGDVDA